MISLPFTLEKQSGGNDETLNISIYGTVYRFSYLRCLQFGYIKNIIREKRLSNRQKSFVVELNNIEVDAEYLFALFKGEEVIITKKNYSQLGQIAETLGIRPLLNAVAIFSEGLDIIEGVFYDSIQNIAEKEEIILNDDSLDLNECRINDFYHLLTKMILPESKTDEILSHIKSKPNLFNDFKQIFLQIHHNIPINLLCFLLQNMIECDYLSADELKIVFQRRNNEFYYKFNQTDINIKNNNNFDYNALMAQIKNGRDELNTRNKDNLHHILIKIIQNDEIHAFQEMVTNEDQNKIKLNLLHRFNYVVSNFNYPSLIEYAALCRSTQIFKFLFLNGAKYNDELTIYAVEGGNYEIIHLCEQKNLSFENCLSPAIKFKRYEIFEWLWTIKNIRKIYGNNRNTNQFQNQNLSINGNGKNENEPENELALLFYCLENNSFRILQFLISEISTSLKTIIKLFIRSIKYYWAPDLENHHNHDKLEKEIDLNSDKYCITNIFFDCFCNLNECKEYHFLLTDMYEISEIYHNNIFIMILDEILSTNNDQNINENNFEDYQSIQNNYKADIFKFLMNEVIYSRMNLGNFSILHFICEKNCSITNAIKYLPQCSNALNQINSRDSENRAPIHIACSNVNSSLIRNLTSIEGIDINARYKSLTPLQILCSQSSKKNLTEDDFDLCVCYMLKNPNIDVNALSYSSSDQASMHARDQQQLHIDFAVTSNSGDQKNTNSNEIGNDVNKAEGKGRLAETALHLAAKNGHDKVIKRLLEFPGINFEVEDSENRRPFQVCIDEQTSKAFFNYYQTQLHKKANFRGGRSGQHHSLSSSKALTAKSKQTSTTSSVQNEVNINSGSFYKAAALFLPQLNANMPTSLVPSNGLMTSGRQRMKTQATSTSAKKIKLIIPSSAKKNEKKTSFSFQ